MAAAQLGGTDIPPTEPAWLAPADIAGAVEPRPLEIADRRPSPAPRADFGIKSGLKGVTGLKNFWNCTMPKMVDITVSLAGRTIFDSAKPSPSMLLYTEDAYGTPVTAFIRLATVLL
ncbi:Uncharacterised protein [Mycobacterium tuberculosis]|uniref:Uncharacterized protein n=2 Tax=Mycobacterium tuberculosis TaxID=1773 RepID=A0A654U806_MYCTX|nr:Uncharacterised protein [Mycobacterium tuberculosis]CNV96653.1 Uncharacterised protein [Mycobacterium tuberculosis]